MFNDRDKLLIFENFVVDRTLPKYVEREKARAAKLEEMKKLYSSSDQKVPTIKREILEEMADSGDLFSRASLSVNSLIVDGNDRVSSQDPVWSFREPRWYHRLFRVLPSPKMEKHKAEIDIFQFFHSVKNTAVEIAAIDKRIAGYERLLANAKKAGQDALAEQLAADLAAVRSETQLVAIGLNRFVNEDALVEFVKKTERGLRLDWVRNFNRIIPEDVLAKKVRADELHVFDNYVVLHFDPQGKSWAETEREKKARLAAAAAKRRDPILFGVIKGRRALYFVGDWVDEFCDLTFDQVAKALPNKVGTLSETIGG